MTLHRTGPMLLAALVACSGATHAQLEYSPVEARALSGQHPVFGGQISTGERFGRACTGLGDVDGDGIPDIAVGSRSDQDGGTDAGAVYVVFMNRDLTPRAAVKLGALGSGGIPDGTISAGDMFGYGVAGIGDLDGDGVPDLAITAPNAELPGQGTNANRGALFVCLLHGDGTVRSMVRIDDSSGLPLVNGDSFGQACANLGDLDGDGLPEIGVGAPGTDDGAFNGGAAYVVSVGPTGELLRHTRIGGTTAPRLLALEDVDNFGGRGMATIGDLDGDGAVEVAVGCYRDDDGGLDRGAVWVLSLRPGPKGLVLEQTTKLSAIDGGLPGPIADEDLFGMTVAPLGDLDADGIPDLAVGNNKSDVGGTDMGTVFLLGMGRDRRVKSQAVVSDVSGFPGLDLVAGERFGRALANFGDIRGDGSTVLGVGAGAGLNGGRLWFVTVATPRSPDFNGDGIVDGIDLGTLLSNWTLPGRTDLDWTGRTDGADLARLLQRW
jgi:hypothetical protein